MNLFYFSVSSHQLLGRGSTYPCDTCKREYRRVISLQRHKRFECGKEAQFECVICHSRFKHKHSLQRHYKVHLSLQDDTSNLGDLKQINSFF